MHFFLALLIWGPVQSWAFESFSEYRAITETQQSAADKPELLDSEWLSDYLTYSKNIEMEGAQVRAQDYFDLSIGSLSGSTFLIDNRFKLKKSLSNQLEFRLSYWSQRNYEEDDTHLIPELIFWPWQSFGFSTYGEASYFKRENDLGLAIIWRPEQNHEIRFYNTFVDLVREDRNDRKDHFINNASPMARGISGKLWNIEKEFLEYNIRYETPTEWEFPDEKYVYMYEKKLVSFTGVKNISEKYYLGGRAEFEKKLEAWQPQAGSSVTYQNNVTEKTYSEIGIHEREFGPFEHWEATLSLGYSHHDWAKNFSKAYETSSMPFVTLKIPGVESSRDFWVLEYMLTFFRQGGDGTLRSQPTVDDSIEQRFNYSYEFHFPNAGTLRLSLTFDVDRFFKEEPFEGGNGQFFLEF